MKKLILCLFFISATFSSNVYSKQPLFHLKGKISDENGKPISFANLTIQELSESTISDEKGNYFFSSIPEGNYYLTVNRTGYLNKTVSVNVTSEETVLDITLEKSLIETLTIDVTSTFNPSEISNSTYSVTSIGPRTLSSIRNQNIASTIQNIPGVNNFSTGSAIGKPVIRGLTSQSVIIVHDGVKHESQQWGDEHAPEISIFDIDRIEILRGPASLIYGSDGIGGVVNIISKPLQFSTKNKPITYGALDLNGYSVNTEGTGNIMLGLGTKNFGINGHIGYRKGEDVRTPDAQLTINTPDGERIIDGGKLFNSGSKEFEGGVNLVYKSSFGTITAEYENFSRELQLHDDPVESPGATANQKLVTNHYEAKGNIFLNKKIQLEPILSYETHIRKEFESIEDKNSDKAVLNWDLKIFQSDLRLNHILAKNFTGTFGGSIETKDNKTFGVEKLVPNYTSFSYGIYALEKYEQKYFTISGGIRYDNKDQKIKETVFETDSTGNPTKVINPRDLNFNTVTGSAGFVYKPLSSLDIFANVGRGWRAPSEFDLYADGVHEGTGRFDKGLLTIDSTLTPKPEESLNIDLGTRIRTKYFNGEISFFRNLVNNFIYPSPTGETDSASNLPIYDIKQDKSTFLGFEYNLQFQPMDWILLSFKGDFVDTKNKVTNNPLPFTPAAKNIIEIKFQKNNIGKLYNPYVNIGTKIVSSATKVDPLEASTNGYTLWNTGLGFDFVLSKSVASVDFSVSNLANTKYIDHLSRYRYYAMNPGRSFNLKFTLPFQF